METKWIWSNGAEFEDARRVRHEVFVQEQGFGIVGEFDALDAESWHIIAYEEQEPVATARMFMEGDGSWHVGRVAVLAAARGQGLGLWLMQQIENKARQMGAKSLTLNAQADKYAFYERAGFVLTGETMMDEGCPHVGMLRLLAERQCT